MFLLEVPLYPRLAEAPALPSVFGPLKKLEFGELVAIHGAGASRDTGREGEGEGERE